MVQRDTCLVPKFKIFIPLQPLFCFFARAFGILAKVIKRVISDDGPEIGTEGLEIEVGSLEIETGGLWLCHLGLAKIDYRPYLLVEKFGQRNKAVV